MLLTPKSRGDFFLASSLRDGLEDNDIKQVKTLLSSKEADPNVLIPTHGISPFHIVIGNESATFAEEVTKLFLRHGGNPNIKSSDGMTPVHVAAAWGRVPILELLLANGGDPLCIDDDGRSPFHYAFEGGHYEAVAALGKYCGTNQDEDENEDKPKYKLTLDKILINKGNVVAEYVPSDVSHSTSIKSETNYISESFQSTKIVNISPLQRSSSISAVTNTEKSSFLKSDNITLRRYHKNRQQPSATKVNLNTAFAESNNINEERLLVGQIIDRLSMTYVKDSSISDKSIPETEKSPIKANNASLAINKLRSFLLPPKYQSRDLHSKKTPRPTYGDTSIISKSPNIRLLSSSDSIPTCLKNQKVTSVRNYTPKSKHYNTKATPTSRSEKRETDVKIRGANSTPKKKQQNVFTRPYDSAKAPKLREKIDKNENQTPLINDETSYSSDNERNLRKTRNVDDKYIGKNIAIKLDDRMYDEHSESDKNSDTTPKSTKLRPRRIFNSIKSEFIADERSPKSCNVAEDKLEDFSSQPNLLTDKKVSTLIETPGLMCGLEIKRENDEEGIEQRGFCESPGSSNPVSYCCSEYSIFNNEDKKIWLEIEEADRSKCLSPPASVSMLDSSCGDSVTASPNDSINIAHTHTFYSNYSKEGTQEFYDASADFQSAFPKAKIMASSSSISESFMSVEEEYTYEDAEEGVVFIERHLCVIPASTYDGNNRIKQEPSLTDQLDNLSLISSDYSRTISPRPTPPNSPLDGRILRDRLTALGEMPGPITKSTYNVYLKRLWKLERASQKNFGANPATIDFRNDLPSLTNRPTIDYSVTIPNYLLQVDWATNLQKYRILEEQAFKEYATANPTRKYRGGISKTSFCYLLLDPRITRDLPRSGVKLTMEERWKIFVESLFYVGKGKAARPMAHLYDAFGAWTKKKQEDTLSRKIRRILDIWREGQGVVCLQVFSHSMLEEACSREAAMIDAAGTAHLTNCNRGSYYGYMTTMNSQEKSSLGKYLLYKSMEILMHEGERQLFPRNVNM